MLPPSFESWTSILRGRRVNRYVIRLRLFIGVLIQAIGSSADRAAECQHAAAVLRCGGLLGRLRLLVTNNHTMYVSVVLQLGFDSESNTTATYSSSNPGNHASVRAIIGQ